jgi:hypothetical protein
MPVHFLLLIAHIGAAFLWTGISVLRKTRTISFLSAISFATAIFGWFLPFRRGKIKIEPAKYSHQGSKLKD